MNRWFGWWTVLCKEVMENARDRRALLSALLYGPLIGPVLFSAMIGFILGQQQEDVEKTLHVPVVGVEHAPNLVEFLRTRGVVIEPAPDDPEAVIRQQQEDLVLRIPEDFGSHWTAGKPARVEVLYDQSRRKAQIPVQRLQSLLQGYGRQIGLLRLQLRGIAPSLATPIVVAERDLSTAQSRAGALMAMLPYFLILSAFVGGMYLAIDVTAGERERQSLEPLLLNPVTRAQVLSGKLLATAGYAAVSLLICVCAFALAMRFIPTAGLGFDLALPAVTVLRMALVVLPLALLAASSQIIVASFSKSFREAQTYLQFLILLPAAPSIVLMLNPVRTETWMIATPLLSQSVLITDLVRGDAVSADAMLLSVTTSVLTALLLGLIAVRLYQREETALAV